MNATSLSRPSDAVRRTVRRRARRPVGTGAIRALILRDWGVMRSYRAALILDLAFGFVNLTAYHFISQTVRPRFGAELQGAPSYFAFAAVGIALMVVLQASVTGLARRLREEQLAGTLEMLLAQPISSAELALGLAGFPFLFAIFRALAYLLLGGAFLGLSFAHCDWLGLLVSFLVSGFAFAAIGIVLASLVVVFKRAEAAATVGTAVIGLLGGAVFPIAVLPAWLKPVATIIPTRFALNAVRGALFGTHAWAGSALTLLIVGACLMVAALCLFGAAVRLVIRLGTVSQY